MRKLYIQLGANLMILVAFLFIALGHVFGASASDRVVLYTMDGCEACEIGKQHLNQAHIQFTESHGNKMFYPTLNINGKFYGVGLEAVDSYISERQGS